MEKTQVVIYDDAQDYVYALVQYVMQQCGETMEVAGFSDIASLEAYCAKSMPDVLLANAEAHQDVLKELRTGQLLWLCEETMADAGDIPTIEKYQSAEEVVRQIYEHYQPAKQSVSAFATQGSTKIISVYSPGQMAEQTPFAATIAMHLKRDHKVLYVNLRENAAFEQILEKEYAKDLSDAIYLSNRRTEGFSGLLSSLVHENQDLVYVPPMEHPLDSVQLAKEEWMNFLEKLETESGYEYIVFDLCGMVPVFYEILLESQRIFIPMENNRYSKAQETQFERRLQHMGLEKLLLRMEKIQMPKMPELLQAEDMLTNWIWGDMGEFVRELFGQQEAIAV